MEISKDSYSKMNTDSKLDVIYDILKSTHDCVKGDNGEGLDDRITKNEISVASIENSLKWLQRFQLFILGLIGLK